MNMESVGIGCSNNASALLASPEISWSLAPVVKRPTLLADWDDRVRQLNCRRLTEGLTKSILSFSSPVVVRGKELAAPVSRLVQLEALQLAARFAELGLDAARDDLDEVVMPSVHQSSVGSVQFEWHRHGIDLEIAVLPSGRILGYVEARGEGREIDLSAGLWEVETELGIVLVR